MPAYLVGNIEVIDAAVECAECFQREFSREPDAGKNHATGFDAL